MRYVEYNEGIFQSNEKMKDEELYLLYVQPEKLQNPDFLEVYAVPRDNFETDNWSAYVQELDDKYGLLTKTLKDNNAVCVCRISKTRCNEFSTIQSDDHNVTLSERQYNVIFKLSKQLASTAIQYRKSNRNLLELKSSPEDYGQRFLARNPKGQYVLSNRENVKEGTILDAVDTFKKEAKAQGWDLSQFSNTTDYDVYKNSITEDEDF